MAERPRSRTSVVVGLATTALILVLATVVLLITTPWNDPVPPVIKHKPASTSTR